MEAGVTHATQPDNAGSSRVPDQAPSRLGACYCVLAANNEHRLLESNRMQLLP